MITLQVLQSKNANLRPHKKPGYCKKETHFFLRHLGAPRAPLSIPECRGTFVGTQGMIVV